MTKNMIKQRAKSTTTHRKPNIHIFLTSFLILFLELALIRFLPAQISYLGYYSNFILLASFVGIGIGILLAKDGRNFIWNFPLVLLFLISFSSLFAISVYPDSFGEIHFHSSFQGLVIPEMLFVPIIFFLTASIFVLLSQRLGRLLSTLPPLAAYTWDILGSILGISVFTLLSYLRTNPVVWFSIFAIVFLWSLWEKSRQWVITCVIFLVLLFILMFTVQGTTWSPYQKITTIPIYSPHNRSEIIGYTLLVNNISHQSAVKDISYKEWVYTVPYKVFNTNKFKRVLIIGAGMGTDVALALSHAQEIDAVEIDPEILRAGQKLNPNKPYENPRVHVFIDDARSFLEKKSTTYDLIIFALPDSLMLASTHGNIRLESFLFTREAFAVAKKHLTADGALVLYNHYRRPWLIAKLSGMLEEVFGRKSYAISDNDNLAILINGNKLDDLRTNAQQSATFTNTPKPATDDWPFLYLEKPSLPIFYLLILGIMLGSVYTLLSYVTQKPFYKIIQPTYFFLGAGFLLMETKSIIQFSLLFGTTWITNAFVFLAILTAVLLAIQIAARFPIKTSRSFYIALAIALCIQYFFPLQVLLTLHPFLKYLIVSLITFAPVFLANIIFSITFKHSKDNAGNFASNILGAAFGGVLEYFALLLGYHHLVLIIAACYFFAFLAPQIRQIIQK